MALFDMNDPNITLLPLDTKGTVSGARDAVNQAVAQNAKLILGPLLAQNVAQAGQSARAHNLNVIGFTTDRSRIGGNVFTLGILPYDQGQRLAKYAAKRNLNRIVILTPDNPYAREVTQAFRDMTAKSSLSVVETITVDSRDGLNEAELNRLASLSGDFDGLLMPFGNPYLNAAAEDLNRVGLNAQTTAWLGTGIWDEPTILRNAAMRGAFYAAPSADQRKRFERKYQSIYGERPERLASLGYDAVALSVVLMRQTGGEINRAALLNPNGFMGTDGAFRFRADGITERSLAIQRIEGMGRVRPVDAAPTRF
jgi:ABC-type branched-subunit amino acid transport system substrate-binding protein